MSILEGVIGGLAGALSTLLGTKLLQDRSERSTAVVALGAELAHNLSAACHVVEKNAPYIKEPSESQWWELVSFSESSWNAVVVSGSLYHLKREVIGPLAKSYAELGRADYSAEKLQSGRVDPRKAKQYTVRVFDAGESVCKRLRYVPIIGFRDRYDYSNFGMTLAGDVAAKVAGSNWEDISERVLFDPVGMASTSMRHHSYLKQANRAELHVKIDGQWKPAFKRNPDAQAPAGGCSSNVVDLARWVRLSLKGGRLGDQTIIDKEALDATHTPVIMNGRPHPNIADPASFYGLGWVIGMTPYREVEWNHSGAFTVGAATVAKLIPSEGLGIVVLTNGAPIGVPEAIVDAYFNHLHSIAVTDDEVFALWQKRSASIYGELIKPSKPENPTAARPDTAYVGTYTNPYVGDIEIVAQNGKLEIVEGPNHMRFTLEHLDGDTFIYTGAPEMPDYPADVKFTVGPNGVATALTNSAFNATGQGTLTRV